MSAGQAAVGVGLRLSVNPVRSAGYLAPLALLGAFAVVSVLALVARRLLGLRGGLIRTLLCAVLGLAVGGSLIGPHLNTTAETAALFPVMIGVQLLTTVLALLLIDAILPRRSPASWVRGAQHRMARARRYAQVSTIATRNGLVRQVRARPRFGDHDRNVAFARFEPRPLAAASVGQVHRATLPSGEHVVVKVQRPGITTVVDHDLDIVLRDCSPERTGGEARKSAADGMHSYGAVGRYRSRQIQPDAAPVIGRDNGSHATG